MNNKQKNKTTTWGMRADNADKAHISRLAKHLGCSNTKAVLRAVRYTLAIIEKIEKESRHLV